MSADTTACTVNISRQEQLFAKQLGNYLKVTFDK